MNSGHLARTLLIAGAMVGVFASVSLNAQPAQPAAKAQAPAPSQDDQLLSEASALNAQRDRAFRDRNLDALVALYTSDAAYVELLPALQAMRGQTEIKLHMQELFDEDVRNISTNVQRVTRSADGSVFVSGDYSLVVNNSIIAGNFVQVLRREGGAWKIAEHIFARPELITESERRDVQGD